MYFIGTQAFYVHVLQNLSKREIGIKINLSKEISNKNKKQFTKSMENLLKKQILKKYGPGNEKYGGNDELPSIAEKHKKYLSFFFIWKAGTISFG